MAAVATEGVLFKEVGGLERAALAVHRIYPGTSTHADLCRLSASDHSVQIDLRWSEGLVLGEGFGIRLVGPGDREYAVHSKSGSPLRVLSFDAARGVSLRIEGGDRSAGTWGLYFGDTEKLRRGEPGRPPVRDEPEGEAIGVLYVEVLCRSAVRLRCESPRLAEAGDDIPLGVAISASGVPLERAKVSVEVDVPAVAIEEVVVRHAQPELVARLMKMVAASPLPPERRKWWNLPMLQQLGALADFGVVPDARRRIELRPAFNREAGAFHAVIPAAETTAPGTYNIVVRSVARGEDGVKVSRVDYRQIIVAPRPRADFTALDVAVAPRPGGRLRYTVDCTFRDALGNTFIVRDPAFVTATVSGAQALHVAAEGAGVTRISFEVPRGVRFTRRLRVALLGRTVLDGYILPNVDLLRPGLVEEAPDVEPERLHKLGDPLAPEVGVALRPGRPLLVRPPSGGMSRSVTVFTAGSSRAVPYRVDVLRGETTLPVGIGWGTESFQIRGLESSDAVRISVAANTGLWERDLAEFASPVRRELLGRPGWQQAAPAVFVHGVGFR
ncbi:hypothetical protein [Nannocystis pusilla]|uniref:hypothetical protein n=1 Tax=Nannocystis pusilla TaxID=889268 RepID=UPI003DA62CB4